MFPNFAVLLNSASQILPISVLTDILKFMSAVSSLQNLSNEFGGNCAIWRRYWNKNLGVTLI